jgi:hypothetical protein
MKKISYVKPVNKKHYCDLDNLGEIVTIDCEEIKSKVHISLPTNKQRIHIRINLRKFVYTLTIPIILLV